MMAGTKVTYASAAAMFSGKTPILPPARTGSFIAIPQPGQNAAVSGMRAAQCGHASVMGETVSIGATLLSRKLGVRCGSAKNCGTKIAD